MSALKRSVAIPFLLYNCLMKLCIFSGTFNPIHNAHIKMAEYVLENYGFDKIIFIPAYKPPHKDYQDNMCIHRYNMVKLAIQNNPKFEISDIEYKNEGKSYSYLTALELYKQYDIDGKINFIIGTDAFEKIETWYETDKFKKLVDFIVFIRENEPVNFDDLRKKGYNFEFAKMNFVDISSTELRERIQKDETVENLIPKEVEEYIKNNGLYRNTEMA